MISKDFRTSNVDCDMAIMNTTTLAKIIITTEELSANADVAASANSATEGIYLVLEPSDSDYESVGLSHQ
ncbi:hypothetical protein PPOP_0084 [Paenibacillus popilliae ATCC 14706]|uniref:Uncharacterized protein n=2 Tax=Paenibacillus popilliae TaxID=78057 RepID=M9L788_PAEPP|nr:hypothetical protein [Paenibacillus popilliae]GAC40757.1 hypothetical protein PPOP_0084 [Paenibacillus popilliae ATCC 14706]